MKLVFIVRGRDLYGKLITEALIGKEIFMNNVPPHQK